MDFMFFLNSTYSTIKDIENFLIEKFPSISKDSFLWNFYEETALGFIEGDRSEIIYFSIPEGAKLNIFSYSKINQVIIIISNEKDLKLYQTYYYRLLRRFNKPQNRLKILSTYKEKDLKNELEELFQNSPKNYQLIKNYQFFYQLDNQSDKETFLFICRENNINNLKFTSVFPVLFQKKNIIGSYMDEENFMYIGELELDMLNPFISSLIEHDFDINKLSIIEQFKSNKQSI